MQKICSTDICTKSTSTQKCGCSCTLKRGFMHDFDTYFDDDSCVTGGSCVASVLREGCGYYFMMTTKRW